MKILRPSDIILNKKVYDQRFTIDHENGYEPYLEIIQNIIIKNNYKTIIDFGCGTGRLGKYLAKTNERKTFKLIGVDISHIALNIARPFYDKVIINTHYQLPNLRADLIVLNSIIEHIYDKNLKILFKNINRKINKHGSVFITVPNITSPHFIISANKIDNIKNGHINLKTANGWKTFFQKNGFTNIKQSFFTHLKNNNQIEVNLCKQTPVLNFLIKKFYQFTLFWPFFHLRDSRYFLIKTKP